MGDDLARIAIRFGVDEDALRAVNGLVGAGPRDIEVGQELILPATSLELQVERVAAGGGPDRACRAGGGQPGSDRGGVWADAGGVDGGELHQQRGRNLRGAGIGDPVEDGWGSCDRR